MADQVLAEWALSEDEKVRFDGLALIDDFPIATAIPALQKLAKRLASLATLAPHTNSACRVRPPTCSGPVDDIDVAWKMAQYSRQDRAEVFRRRIEGYRGALLISVPGAPRDGYRDWMEPDEPFGVQFLFSERTTRDRVTVELEPVGEPEGERKTPARLHQVELPRGTSADEHTRRALVESAPPTRKASNAIGMTPRPNRFFESRDER